MDVLDGVPKRVLGREIPTRWTVILTFLIPTSLELIAYLIQTLADIGVVVQLFRDKESGYALLTALFVILAPFITFTLVILSPWQWPEPKGCSATNLKFLLRQIFNFILFPVGAIERFSRRIFWSIEALFNEDGSEKRHHSLQKAAETSPFELYRFVQAYVQAAPQVILQLFILLREDIFRNYETTDVQILSIVFSLVNIAVITMSYQRFESQKVVGRHYPWSTNQYVQHRRQKFMRTRSRTDELIKIKKRSAEVVRTFPETEHIMRKFQSQHLRQAESEPTTFRDSSTSRSSQIVEPRPGSSRQSGNLISSQNVTSKKSPNNMFDLLEGIDELDTTRRRSVPESDWSTIESASIDDGEYNPDIRRKLSASQIRIQSMSFDYVPDIPPPKPPTAAATGGIGSSDEHGKRTSFNPLNRLSQFTERMVLKTEMYIKEHVPRPPEILIQRALSQEERDKAASQARRDDTNDIIRGSSPSQMTNPHKETSLAKDISSQPIYASIQKRPIEPVVTNRGETDDKGGDELDFFLPSRKKMIQGVEQDDFAGKVVSFFGWILFIYMRMISLSVFCVFYPMEFVYLIGAHYGLMLLCLAIESRFKDKCDRILFYFCLAYIYIFVILEFKIKFQHVRSIYIGYLSLVLLENFIITRVWNDNAEFYAWIYDYLYYSIMISGALTLMCMIVYYGILRPPDVILFEDVENNEEK